MQAWEGFDTAAMWVELDALEASAKAARAAKAAAKAAGEAPEKPIAAEKPARVAAETPECASKPSVTFTSEPPSVFAAPQAIEIADKLPDTAPPTDQDVVPALRSLRSSRSVRMRALGRKDSIAAVDSGIVSAQDLQHLEAEVEVEVPIPDVEVVEKDAY